MISHWLYKNLLNWDDEVKEGFMILPDKLLGQSEGKMFYVFDTKELQ